MIQDQDPGDEHRPLYVTLYAGRTAVYTEMFTGFPHDFPEGLTGMFTGFGISDHPNTPGQPMLISPAVTGGAGVTVRIFGITD